MRRSLPTREVDCSTLHFSVKGLRFRVTELVCDGESTTFYQSTLPWFVLISLCSNHNTTYREGKSCLNGSCIKWISQSSERWLWKPLFTVYVLGLLFSSFTDARIPALREPGQHCGTLQHNSVFLLWCLGFNMLVVKLFSQASYDIWLKKLWY